MNNKKEQGKKNKAAGLRFERKVRKELEEQGYIVSKWQNNIKIKEILTIAPDIIIEGDIIPARTGFGGYKNFRIHQSGFPDFIIWKTIGSKDGYEIIGLECKINGLLDKIEKEKVRLYKEKMVFSKFLLAKKQKNKIIYEELW